MKYYNIIFGLGITVLSNGCNNLQNNSDIKCDSKETISLSEQILNNQIIKNGNLKLDKNNIVIWNYNDVGRYECKAKVNGILKVNNNEKFVLPLYGLSVDKKTNKIIGWINYKTYKTTTNLHYVEIKRIK